MSKWKRKAFDARDAAGRVSVRDVEGWTTGRKPDSFVYHRSLSDPYAWTVSDPKTGLAFIQNLPTRTVAERMVEELHAVVRRYGRRYRGLAA
jgi:hypothetical protein